MSMHICMASYGKRVPSPAQPWYSQVHLEAVEETRLAVAGAASLPCGGPSQGDVRAAHRATLMVPLWKYL